MLKIFLSIKKDLNPDIKEKEINEKVEERKDLSNLYSLMENCFYKMSSYIVQLSTSINQLTKEKKEKNTKFTKVLQILNDNLIKTIESNNIKYSTDSQEIIRKILDKMEKDISPNRREDNKSIAMKN